jgi:hypothetical protein
VDMFRNPDRILSTGFAIVSSSSSGHIDLRQDRRTRACAALPTPRTGAWESDYCKHPVDGGTEYLRSSR